MQTFFVYQGQKIPYMFVRGGVKNINAHVRRDGSLYVSAPRLCSADRVKAFLLSRAPVLLSAMAAKQNEQAAAARPLESGTKLPLFGEICTLQLLPGYRRTVTRAENVLLLTYEVGDDDKTNRKTLATYLRGQAVDAIGEICREIYLNFYKDLFPYPEIRFRRMTARWGSCSKAGGFLILNTALVYAPIPAIQYVVAHEFTHMLYMDHSPRFYAELAARMPDYKARRALLKQINLNTEKWL